MLALRGEAGIGKSTLVRWADRTGGRGGFHLAVYNFDRGRIRPRVRGLGRPRPTGARSPRSAPELAGRRFAAAVALGPPAQAEPLGIYSATLGLLAAAAEAGPVLVVVDDAQWLDQPSAEALRFVARRLDAEGIALVFSLRNGFSTPLTEAHCPDVRSADSTEMPRALSSLPLVMRWRAASLIASARRRTATRWHSSRSHPSSTANSSSGTGRSRIRYRSGRPSSSSSNASRFAPGPNTRRARRRRGRRHGPDGRAHRRPCLPRRRAELAGGGGTFRAGDHRRRATPVLPPARTVGHLPLGVERPATCGALRTVDGGRVGSGRSHSGVASGRGSHRAR